GIGTADITLYPIGGVARLQGVPRSPSAEFLIALAGPAVNLSLVIALALAFFLGGGVVPAVAEWLGLGMAVNLVLALSNLIPAFPMDGGRVLRAALSGMVGRLRATEIAAGLGRALAIGFGIYCLLHGDLVRVALAAFIYFAAGMELAQVVADER